MCTKASEKDSMANGFKCRTEIQEDEKCDMFLVHVEEDVNVIGYLQELSLSAVMYTVSRLCPREKIVVLRILPSKNFV